MTAPRPTAAGDVRRVVLICQSCRYAWEPASLEWTADYLRALSAGCPECGDWLYLGEIAERQDVASPRRDQP